MSNATVKPTPSTSNVRIKSIALPVEHGGWAFLIEPLLLGILLAPSLPGLFLCLAAFGVFLLYQPLQITLKDRLRQKRYPRTILAERFIVLYGSLILLGGLGLLLTDPASLRIVLLAMLAAAPFACVQMLLVIRGHARDAVTEICGACALGVTASALVMMRGWSFPLAFALWLVPIVRAATSILYVRTRLRWARGSEANKAIPIAAHVTGVVLMIVMVANRLLPIGSLLALLVLLGRAIYGLYAARLDTPTRIIGFQEIAFGLITVLLVVISYQI